VARGQSFFKVAFVLLQEIQQTPLVLLQKKQQTALVLLQNFAIFA